ncbi:MAG: lipopolysaccharide transport periplasmic protein LptA [Mariprofundaceae bacterium]
MMPWAFLALALAVSPALASETAKTAAALRIEADAMHIDHARHTAVFTGHVRLDRGDFHLDCARLTTRYRKRGGLEQATAEGEVRIRQGEAHGQADRARLDERKGIVRLIGHAVMQQAGRRIEGDVIVHDINAGRTQVLPREEGGRARMIIEDDGTSEP